MPSLITRRASDPDTPGKIRFGGRAVLGLLGLALLAQPFLLLLLSVRRRWAALERLDVALAATFNEAANDSVVLLGAARAITHLGGVASAVYFFVVLTAFLWVRRQRRFAAFAAVTGLGVAALVPLTKVLVDRARPIVAMPVAETPSNASFPSGHAMTSVAMGGALVLLSLPAVRSRLRPWVVAGAVMFVVLVGLSRLVLGVHFASDVIAGWSLGAAWLTVTSWCFRAWQRSEGNVAAERAGLGVDDPAASPASTARPVPDIPAIGKRLVVWAGAILAALILVGMVLTGPLAGTWLARVDADLAKSLVGIRTDRLNQLAAAVGSLAGVVTVPAVVVAMGVMCRASTDSWRPAVFLTIATAGSSTIYLVSSRIVARARPDVADLTSGLPPGTSWPSGHAAAAVTLYGALAALAVSYSGGRLPRWVAVALPAVTGAAVGLSRMYVAAHHLSDVIAGLCLGAGWLLVCVRLLLPRPAGEKNLWRDAYSTRGMKAD